MPITQTHKPQAPGLALASYLLLAVVIIGNLIYSLTIGGLDFSVYRAGAMTLFNTDGFDKELYVIDLHRATEDLFLPFTYPPFAAMLFLPFAWLPHWAGITLMMLLAFGVSWWLATLIYNYAQHRGYQLPLQEKLGRYGTIALIASLILLSGPWRRGLGLVQINPLIMLLVLADFIRPATKVPRGVLIGIAGAIKLTPLAFGLILLMRKDFRGVITLGITFFSTVALGFLLMPKEAQEFWFHAVSDPSRVGNINYPDNVSIRGWLMHLGIPEGTLLSLLTYGLVLVLMAGVAYLIPLLHRQQMVLSQIALNAFLMISMSPISWSHHNTWLPLLLAGFWLDAFPVFFRHLSEKTRSIAKVLSWVGGVGLFISPLWIAATIKGSTHDLENVPFIASVLASVPIISIFAVVLLWIYAGIKRQKAS